MTKITKTGQKNDENRPKIDQKIHKIDQYQPKSTKPDQIEQKTTKIDQIERKSAQFDLLTNGHLPRSFPTISTHQNRIAFVSLGRRGHVAAAVAAAVVAAVVVAAVVASGVPVAGAGGLIRRRHHQSRCSQMEMSVGQLPFA